MRLGHLKKAHDVKADILAKIESFNPDDSVKDRSAFGIVGAMEAESKLGPEAELIDATSGNNRPAYA